MSKEATPRSRVGVAAAVQALQKKAASRVRGQERAIEDFLLCSGARGHQLLLGVPGTGKTMLAKVLGRLVGLQAGRVQFTQDLLPTDITGHFVFNRETNQFTLRPGPVFCNILLGDEINRAPTKTQSALLECMEEHQVTIEGKTFALPDPFVVIATMNPVDLEGVHRLPVAQMDRFTIQTRMDYPSPRLEVEFLADPPGADLRTLEAIAKDLIPRLQKEAGAVRVHPDLLDYLVRLLGATRSHPDVLLGLSPRAGEQILDVAKVFAILRGRTFATPEDIQSAFRRCSSHRIFLRADAADGSSAESVIDAAVRTTPTPETA